MLRVSQIIVAAALIGLAILGLFHQDFCVVFGPNPATSPKWLYMLGDVLLLGSAAMVITRKLPYIGSMLCCASIFLFAYVLKVIPELAGLNVFGIINNAESWEILGLIGGCLILATSFKKNKFLFTLGLALISGWFLWAGIGHFQFYKYVVSLIPAYVPFHSFWVYLCGICLMLAGVGLWIPKLRLLTARLAAIMLLLWCGMLHIPNYIANQADVGQLLDVYESLSFAAIMGIIAFGRAA